MQDTAPSARAAKPDAWKPWLFRGLLLLGVLLPSELLLRMLSAYIEPGSQSRDPLHWIRPAHEQHREKIAEYQAVNYAYTPYSIWLAREFHGKFVNYGPDGFRATVNPSKAERRPTIRIAFFGASAMAGFGAEDAETIPSLVASLLSEMLPSTNVECRNLAVGAYNSTQELLLFYREAVQKEQHFDYAVFYDGIGDYQVNYHDRDAGSHEAFGGVARNIPFRGAERTPLFWLAVEDLGNQRTSFILRYAAKVVRRLSAYSPSVPAHRSYLGEDFETWDEYADRVVELYEKNMDLISEIARRRSVEPVFVLQPALPAYGNLGEELLGLLMVDRTIEPASAVYERWRRFGGRRGFLDLSDVMRDHTDEFFDCCHLTGADNRIVAGHLADFLHSRIRARSSVEAEAAAARP